MLIHYHIEKSAGSSFRDLCRDYFGHDSTEALYGAKAKSTSDRVRNIVFPEIAQQAGASEGIDKEKFDALAAFLMRTRPAFFSTHFIRPMRRRMPKNVMTVAFFRNPVERIVSHYNHWHQQGHFSGSFAEFYTQPRFCNWQAQRFNQRQMQALSFVGLTEAFDDSIAIINAGLGTRLKSRYTNRTVWRPWTIDATRLDQATLEHLAELNAADIELYDAVRERFSRDLTNANRT